MRINYISLVQEGLASYRYHILTPAKELKNLGHNIFISNFPVPNSDVYVFNKHMRAFESDMIVDVKREHPNCKTYFIVCDYHLNTAHRDHYLKMIERCDQLVVCTNEMRRLLLEETGKDSVVIKDPWGVDFQEVEPSFKTKDKYNLLWFGSSTNLKGLVDVLPEVGDNNLVVLTDHILKKEIGDPSNVQFKCGKFSTVQLKEEMENADIIIIPQDVTDKRRNVKTHNRLVDSIRNGKFVIASPVDAYRELKDYCFLGSLTDGLKWVSEQKEETINKMVIAGQEYIRKEFSPEKIGKDWENLFMGR